MTTAAFNSTHSAPSARRAAWFRAIDTIGGKLLVLEEGLNAVACRAHPVC